MQYKVISFDLQGTISDAAFSDEFWLELLPQLHSEHHNLPIETSKQILKTEFKNFGRYHLNYYSFDYWLKTLNVNLDWNDLLKRVKRSPVHFPEIRELIIKLKDRYPLLLFSATSRQFIDHELGDLREAFTWIFSALDDLKCAGKPPEAFLYIASVIKVAPQEILHIGDDTLMDIENANAAGWHSFHLTLNNRKELCDLLNGS